MNFDLKNFNISQLDLICGPKPQQNGMHPDRNTVISHFAGFVEIVVSGFHEKCWYYNIDYNGLLLETNQHHMEPMAPKKHSAILVLPKLFFFLIGCIFGFERSNISYDTLKIYRLSFSTRTVVRNVIHHVVISTWFFECRWHNYWNFSIFPRWSMNNSQDNMTPKCSKYCFG